MDFIKHQAGRYRAATLGHVYLADRNTSHPGWVLTIYVKTYNSAGTLTAKTVAVRDTHPTKTLACATAEAYEHRVTFGPAEHNQYAHAPYADALRTAYVGRCEELDAKLFAFAEAALLAHLVDHPYAQSLAALVAATGHHQEHVIEAINRLRGQKLIEATRRGGINLYGLKPTGGAL